jgi:hypothetical protein
MSANGAIFITPTVVTEHVAYYNDFTKIKTTVNVYRTN